MDNNIETAKDTIQVLKAMLSTNQWEPVRRELEFAIKEVKKCIPMRPIQKSWMPNLCPNCGANLGGDCDDGYYENPYYEICPNCRQVLNYDW